MNAATPTDIRYSDLSVSRHVFVFLKKDLAARWKADAAQVSRWYNSGILPEMDVFDASGAALGWTPSRIEVFEVANPRFRERAFPVTPRE